MTSLRLRAFPDRGFLVWFALTGGIVVWIIHLTAFAAIVTFVHEHGYFWLFYAGNGVAVVVTILAMALCWAMVRSTDESEESGSPNGRIQFLGQFGLLINSINLLLIVLEGSYIYFIRTGG
jgi:hypothetical protein